MRKVLAKLLTALVIAAMWLPATQAIAAKPVVILCTNDVHCAMEQRRDAAGMVTNIGYTGVAAYKTAMSELYGAERVTLVDAGDAIQGEAIGTLTNGYYPVVMMNAVGYDFAIPGNHEFDYGVDTLLALSKRADYTYLSCNFLNQAQEQVFQPYQIVDYGDVQVAYVGVSTPESFTKSTPVYFQDETKQYIYSFCAGEGELYAAVQSAVDSARSVGADYVVAVAHLGQDGSSGAWRSDVLVANTTGIDVVVDGHSHQQYIMDVAGKDGKKVLLIQAGAKLGALGKVIIDPATGGVTGELVADYTESDQRVKGIQQELAMNFAAILQREVARTDVTLIASDPATGRQAVRKSETNLGDLCADAYRVMLDADVALVNGGGIRADIPAGSITYEQIINVHPFGNQLSVAEVTGRQLLDALEMGARLYPQENGGFLQASGLTYHIDASVESSVELNERREFIRVNGSRRVGDVTVGGRPLELDKIYRLASHDYMLKQSGDGFIMFRDCNIVADEVMIDNQALIRYITERLGGVVGDEYAVSGGSSRIVITGGGVL